METARIRRILRNIRSKITAISSACEAEPSVYSQFKFNVPDIEPRTNSDNLLQTPRRPQQTSNIVYGGKKRKSSSSLSQTDEELSVPQRLIFAAPAAIFSTPVRQRSDRLNNSFQDILSELRGNQGEEYGSIGGDQSKQSVYTLSELAAFEVGRNYPKGDDEESMEQEEEWYEQIPDHQRRNVLLEHLVQLCIDNLKTIGVFENLIESCVSIGAHFQAYELLKHLVNICPPVEYEHYKWFLNFAKKVERELSFLEELGASLPISSIENASFDKWIKTLPSHKSAIVLAITTPKVLPSLEKNSRITLRFRVESWIQILLHESQRDDNPRSLINSTLKRISIMLSDTAIDATLITCLYTAMIEQSAISGRNFASEDTINSWIQDIKDTFKFVNYAKLYKFIFSNYSGDGESPVDGDEGMGYLNRVVDGLKALCGVTGIEVAAQLLLVIKEQMELEDYLSNKCLLVKAELERVERDMMAMKGSDVEWRFEPLIEAWVEKTPERKLAITNQQQRMQDNSNDSDDSESQSDEEIVSLPSSPLSRRNLRDPKATNSSTLSSKNGTNTRKHTMQSTDTRIAKRRHTQTDIDIEKSIAKENVGNDFEKKWRFEPIIGEWVERTPEKAKKIVRRVSDVY